MSNVIHLPQQKKQLEKPDFESVYKTYYPKVLQYYSKKMANIQDAEDLAGEVFLYCCKNYDSYDPQKAEISTWIYLVAGSRWKNYCRDRQYPQNIDDFEFCGEDGADEMEHAVWLDQLTDSLTNALRQLTERQQRIVILRYFSDKTPSEIAVLLGTNPNNVRVQLSKALKTMKHYMNDFLE